MDRLQEMADEFASLLKEKYPDFTDADISVQASGYMRVSVMQWGEHEIGKITAHTKRRNLLEIGRMDGEWGRDESGHYNRISAERGCLLDSERSGSE